MLASLGVKALLFLLETQNKASYLEKPYCDAPPEATGGVLSRSFFWWLNGLFRTGFQKLMTYDDLYDIDEALSSEKLGNTMQEAWDRRNQKDVTLCP